MKHSSAGLEKQTIPWFMMTLYDHLKEDGQVLKEIGIPSTSTSQLACLMQLPLPFLFSCLQLFAIWVRDGLYDFAMLPFVLKTHMSEEDLRSIQQIPCKWTGRREEGRRRGENCLVLIHPLPSSPLSSFPLAFPPRLSPFPPSLPLLLSLVPPTYPFSTFPHNCS